MATTSPKKDWSATQYLKFHDQRTRPVHDLIAQVRPHMTSPNPLIYDLGCGPGNSTKALLTAFPGSRVTGIDSSPDMLQKARNDPSLTALGASFEQADISTWKPPSPRLGNESNQESTPDLLFSNAAFHWLRHSHRLPTLTALFQNLKPGAVLALQVPDNYTASSHTAMRTAALLGGKSYSRYFSDANIGDLTDPLRPDLDPVESAATWYDALLPFTAEVDVWRTEYQHVLGGPGAVVEWVSGTGLQPYLQRLGGDDAARKEFLSVYEGLVEGAYGEARLGDGRLVLGYMRLFVVAVRK